MSQRLDSLRRDLFLFKGDSLGCHKPGQLLAKCNPYTPQRLDSLRRDFFLFKGTAWAAINRTVAEIIVKKKDSG